MLLIQLDSILLFVTLVNSLLFVLLFAVECPPYVGVDKRQEKEEERDVSLFRVPVTKICNCAPNCVALCPLCVLVCLCTIVIEANNINPNGTPSPNQFPIIIIVSVRSRERERYVRT